MRAQPAPLSQHKLTRLNAWMRLKLAAFVGWCLFWTGLGRTIPRQTLDFIAARVHMLVSLSVADRLPEMRRSPHRHGRLKRSTKRTLAGAHWRRLTRGKRGGDWASRVFAILAFVRDAEVHIVRQLRRLRRGFTRLRVILPLSETCALAAPPLCAVGGADTS